MSVFGKAHFRHLYRFALYQLILLLRNPLVWGFGFIYPIVLLIVLGYAIGDMPASEATDIPLKKVLPWGFIATITAAHSLIIMPFMLSEQRHSGLLKLLKITPLNRFSILTAYICANITYFVAVILLSFFVNQILFGVQFSGISWGHVAVGLILGPITFIALGFVFASLLSNRAAGMMINVVVFLVMLQLSQFSPIPADLLPDWFNVLTTASPLGSLGVFFIQTNNVSVFSNWLEALVLALWAIGALVVVRLRFKWE